MATDGYDALSAAAMKAGTIMEHDTINRLEKARKEIVKFKKELAIKVGEGVGDALATSPKAISDTLGGLMTIVGAINSGMRIFGANLANSLNLVQGKAMVPLGNIEAGEAKTLSAEEAAEEKEEAEKRRLSAEFAKREQDGKKAVAAAQLEINRATVAGQLVDSNPRATDAYKDESKPRSKRSCKSAFSSS